MAKNENYYEKFVDDVVMMFNLNSEDEGRFRSMCKSYGVDWKLGK